MNRYVLGLLCVSVLAACGGDAAPPRFTDLGNGTVQDNVNGLVWQQGFSPESQDQEASLFYCNGLDLDGTGWTLPTKTELLTILDTGHSPPIDEAYFSMRAGGDAFWSSSPDIDVPSNGWLVNFDFGGFPNSVDATVPAYARCVR